VRRSGKEDRQSPRQGSEAVVSNRNSWKKTCASFEISRKKEREMGSHSVRGPDGTIDPAWGKDSAEGLRGKTHGLALKRAKGQTHSGGGEIMEK